jgi:hypothetical protein
MCNFCGILLCVRHIMVREVCRGGTYFVWGILWWVLLFVDSYLNGMYIYIYISFGIFYFK